MISFFCAYLLKQAIFLTILDLIFLLKLHELITNYKLYANKIHDDDYSKIVQLVRKLKNVYKLSKENTYLLDELIYKIISILKNKSCSATSFTSSTKECSLELLKSHIANKLV